MTDLTMGQRIAACRKKLGISQEALGEKVGVSRQAISKWEADGAVPEIDKLIALSKLFSVSVGWLLGVEEQPQAGESSPQISEELLRKIEEIVLRYRPRKEKMSAGKKWLIGIAAVLLIWGGFHMLEQWNLTRAEVGYMSAQLRNNNSQNSNILNQLDALENRIDSINTTVEEAAASLASYDFQITPDLEARTARVALSAVPKNWNEAYAATLSVRHDGKQLVSQTCHWDGTALNSVLELDFTDDLEYWLIVQYPDGTRESIKLEDAQAQNLTSSFTITYEASPVIKYYIQKDETLSIYSGDLYLRRPEPEENPGDWFWARAEYVLYRIRGTERTEVGTSPLLDLVGVDRKATELWGAYPLDFHLPDLQSGDQLELWVMPELVNGVSNHQQVGFWTYENGEFTAVDPAE